MRFCLEGRGEKGRGQGGKEERNDPNSVCTCEYMNNKKEVLI
jgi:hypothetical protein